MCRRYYQSGNATVEVVTARTFNFKISGVYQYSKNDYGSVLLEDEDYCHSPRSCGSSAFAVSNECSRRPRTLPRNFQPLRNGFGINSMKAWRFHKNATATSKILTNFNAPAWLELPDSAFTAHDVPNKNQRRKKSNDMLRRGLYAQRLKPWLNELGKDFFVIFYEKLVAQKRQVWHKMPRFVGASALEMEASTMDKNYSPNNKAKQKAVLQLGDATRAALQRLYRPYNDALADLLGESWRGVWDSIL
jgi:hypothetical protein